MEAAVPPDWHRMLPGADPPLFLFELLPRIAIVWPRTMLLPRWIGGRRISQLSLVEFLLVIALAAAVGDALFCPEVPLVHAMLVIFVVVGIDKPVDQAIRRIEGAKRIIDGRPVGALRGGAILSSATGVRHIGNLELLRLAGREPRPGAAGLSGALGQVSIFAAGAPGHGLPIVPPVECVPLADRIERPRCCGNCRRLEVGAGECPNCGAARRRAAVPAPKPG